MVRRLSRVRRTDEERRLQNEISRRPKGTLNALSLSLTLVLATSAQASAPGFLTCFMRSKRAGLPEAPTLGSPRKKARSRFACQGVTSLMAFASRRNSSYEAMPASGHAANEKSAREEEMEEKILLE